MGGVFASTSSDKVTGRVNFGSGEDEGRASRLGRLTTELRLESRIKIPFIHWQSLGDSRDSSRRTKEEKCVLASIQPAR